MKIFAARIEGGLTFAARVQGTLQISARTGEKLRLAYARLYWRPGDLLTASDVLTIPDILAI